MPTQNESEPKENQNPNIEWASVFVDELAKAGLTAVCIAPGSRSTPLTLAFHAHPKIKVFVLLDERGAGFFALGMAIGEGKCVALVCTSGTATANFHPAIIEARMSEVPLLVLTADRPYELRNSGANQTIDQIKMFGDHVLWSVDVALPQVNVPAVASRYLQTLAARALANADGLVKGPVHLNFPFRKPLEPSNVGNWKKVTNAFGDGQPYTTFSRGSVIPSQSQIAYLSSLIDKHQCGLIICGPGCPGGEFAQALANLGNVCGYPILADPLSGVRYGSHTEDSAVLGSYETFLQNEQLRKSKPDIILRFGKVPTSNWLNNYLSENHTACHIHVRESGVWADGDHTTNHFLQCSPIDLCIQLASNLTRPAEEGWLNFWKSAEFTSSNLVQKFVKKRFFDGSVASAVLDQLPANSSLFVGNSLAIRHIDQFGHPTKKAVRVFSNRGASGIDGNISTGLGIAAATNEQVILLLGDITFYHDSNGLLAIKKYGFKNVIIVLLNNNGGGIFNRLPISQFEPEFQELFLTPHNLDFEPLAKMYGLEYVRTNDLPVFNEQFVSALVKDIPTLIEVQSDSQSDEFARRKIISIVKSKLTGKNNDNISRS